MAALKEREQIIRILLADDHNIFRQGLKEVIDNASDIKVTAEAGTGRGAIREALSDDCDVVLLDLTLPDIAGKTFVQILRKEDILPLNRVLILTCIHNVNNATAYLQYGCAAYLGKPWDNDAIIEHAMRICARKGMHDNLEAIF